MSPANRKKVQVSHMVGQHGYVSVTVALSQRPPQFRDGTVALFMTHGVARV